MNVRELLVWMFPDTNVILLGLVITAAGSLLSFYLNHQSLRNKVLNMGKVGGVLGAFAFWSSILRLAHGEPNPFRSLAVAAAVWAYATLGDWIAFGLHRWDDARDQRAMANVLKKSRGEIVQRTSMARVLSPLLIILTAGMVIGCQIPNPVTSTTLPTITPGETATEPVSVSETPEANTDTPLPPSPTGLPTVPPVVSVEVFLQNPGFEGQWQEIPFVGFQPQGWVLWYFDHKPGEDGRFTVPPEWPIGGSRSHTGGYSSQVFRTWELNDAGVYTEFPTPAGAKECTVSFWGHGWSSEERADSIFANDRKNRENFTGHGLWEWDGITANPDKMVWGPLYSSDHWQPDNFLNMSFYIGTAPGGVNPTAPQVTWSDAFQAQKLDNGTVTILDNWTELTATLPAYPGATRLILRAANRWGTSHNDKYFDDVSVLCNAPALQATSIPMPTGTPVITVTAEPTQESTPTQLPPITPSPEEECTTLPCYISAKVEYTVQSNGLNIRPVPQVNSAITGSYANGGTFFVRCLYIASQTELWGSTHECVGASWSAIYIGQTTFAEPSEGPLGLR